MIRVHKTTFSTSKTDVDRLYACNRISADVWNDCLEIARAYHQEHGKWIDQTQLQKATKGNYSLHSQSIQAVCHKYLWTRESAKKAKRQGFDHIRYPYRQKKHFSTKWAAQGFTLHENGKIHLSLGLHQGKRQKPIVVSIARMPVGRVKEIELIDYLAYKLEAKGIQIRKQEEHGSTQTCPVCNRKHKPSGRIYRCRCGYSRHRDVHGSCGILSRRLYGDIRMVVPVITEQKYLRIA